MSARSPSTLSKARAIREALLPWPRACSLPSSLLMKEAIPGHQRSSEVLGSLPSSLLMKEAITGHQRSSEVLGSLPSSLHLSSPKALAWCRSGFPGCLGPTALPPGATTVLGPRSLRGRYLAPRCSRGRISSWPGLSAWPGLTAGMARWGRAAAAPIARSMATCQRLL